MRGIMFIEALYRQTLIGNKTMTRRDGGLDVVNEHPDNFQVKIIKDNNWSTVFDDWMAGKSLAPETKLEFTSINGTGNPIILKPKYKLGEVLFLKEPYWIDPIDQEVYYKFKANFNTDSIEWKNKMFMAAKYGRTFVKVTGIKCERLLDISSDNCIAEGIESVSGDGWFGWKDYQSQGNFCKKAKDSFLSVYRFANKIKRIPGEDPKNIWVWAYTYELLPYKSLSEYKMRPNGN